MMAIPARSIPITVISFQVMLGSFFKISNLSINIKTTIKPRYFTESEFRPIYTINGYSMIIISIKNLSRDFIECVFSRLVLELQL